MQLKRIGMMVCALVLLGAGISQADVTLHALFADNMVLQQGIEVPIWGTADDGESVTVEFNGQKVTAKADDGAWMARLKPMKAGGPFMMTVQGKNTIEIKNVLIGEVWVCSGQSNMQWSVQASENAQEEIANAKYPQIRLFSVPRKAAGKPRKAVEGEWSECSPETVAGFSAVGYYFGRSLHKLMNTPIGLIHTSWGGTPAESWTTRETLESDPDYKAILDRWDSSYKQFSNDLQTYQEKLDQWKKETDELDAKGEFVTNPPSLPRDPRSNPWRPSSLYNAMIAPLLPYGIQGAIWYQGESNADRAYQYRKLFPAMITDWRRVWGQGDFPFLFVQLANFDTRRFEYSWAELREAQTMTLDLPNTGMAVIVDIGDPSNIHPKNKQDVGWRLALAAQKIAYGEDVVYSGPMYESMKVEGNTIRLRFKHAERGFMVPDGEKLTGFVIAGEDQEFKPAVAAIDGKSIVVSSGSVANPAAVRYGWLNCPVCNLFNKEGLPASPFRTDDWPCVTADNR